MHFIFEIKNKFVYELREYFSVEKLSQLFNFNEIHLNEGRKRNVTINKIELLFIHIFNTFITFCKLLRQSRSLCGGDSARGKNLLNTLWENFRVF